MSKDEVDLERLMAPKIVEENRVKQQKQHKKNNNKKRLPALALVLASCL